MPFVQLGNCVEIGLPMLVLLVICQQVIYFLQIAAISKTIRVFFFKYNKILSTWQYLKRLHPKAHFIVERFALLFCIGVVWAFAAILTAAGAYNNVPEQTKLSCRTDRSYLLSSAPWY